MTALTARGAVWGWGTYRDSSGVMGFSEAQRIQLLPTVVYTPATGDDQIAKLASGGARRPLYLSCATPRCHDCATLSCPAVEPCASGTARMHPLNADARLSNDATRNPHAIRPALACRR
jgi:hypothetical protein